MSRRTGDKIFIPGDYQHNAFYHGHPVQRNWHRLKYEMAIAAAGPQNNDRILDAGCGSGLLASLIAENSTCEIVGTDSNPDAIAFCKKKLSNQHAFFYQLELDALSDQFPAAHFNTIIFLETIEHITQAQGEKVLAQFHRLLKPGGKLIISTPNRKSLWTVQEKLLDLFRLVPRLQGDQHEYLYTSGELQQLAHDAGFTTVSLQTILFAAPWLSFLGNRIVDQVHSIEKDSKLLPGSLLFHTYTK